MSILGERGYKWGWGRNKKTHMYQMFGIKINFATDCWDRQCELPPFFLPVRKLDSVTCSHNSIPVKAENSWNFLSQLSLQLGCGHVIRCWSMRYQRGNLVAQGKIVLSRRVRCGKSMWKFSCEDVRLYVITAILKIGKRTKSSQKTDKYLSTEFLTSD